MALLVEYYKEKGVIQRFKKTMNYVIYPKVMGWLNKKLSKEKDTTSTMCFNGCCKWMTNWEALVKVWAGPPC